MSRVVPSPSPSPAGAPPVLSVVVPMHNEQEVVPEMLARLLPVLEATGESYEVICVDDGSTDATAALIAGANDRDPRIKLLRFSRNFGKENAMTAGIDWAAGAAVVIIDADLQDPPELIPAMLEKWREGFDVVCGQRVSRRQDSWTKRTTARWFYRVINSMSRVPVPENVGDFRLMDRRVVTALGRMHERNRFMKGLFAWVGFKTAYLPYERPERHAGHSKFAYWRLWNFALDGITGYSTLPLRISGYLGLATALLAVIYAAFLVIRTLILGVDAPGYASTMVVILFLGGVQLVVLGVIGEYLGRLYEESKARPIYILDEALGFAPPSAEPVGARRAG